MSQQEVDKFFEIRYALDKGQMPTPSQLRWMLELIKDLKAINKAQSNEIRNLKAFVEHGKQQSLIEVSRIFDEMKLYEIS